MSPALVLLSPGDPERRTGGYLYNKALVCELREMGARVQVLALAGPWGPGAPLSVLQEIEPGGVVLADGLLWGHCAAHIPSGVLVTVLVHSLLAWETQDPDLLAPELQVLASARALICTGREVQQVLAGHGLSSTLAWPGTAPAPAAPYLMHHPLRLLNIGTLSARKDQLGLLRSLSKLRHLEWTLDCVGSMERSPQGAARVQRAAQQLGLGQRVRLLGEVSTISPHYQRADLLVHAATHEAFGMALTEAAAHGLPILSTPAGALELLPKGGWRALDAEHQALAALLESPGQLQEMAEAMSHAQLPTWRGCARAVWGALWGEEPAEGRRQPVAVESVAHGFDAGWLAQREPYDHQARLQSLGLLQGLPRGARVVDLACGSGSNPRFLAPRLGGAQSWTLVDHDPRLLDAARACLGMEPGLHQGAHAPWGEHQVATLCCDLRAGFPQVQAELVVTTALLDLVDAGFVRSLVRWLEGRAILASLTVDGGIQWQPQDAQDPAVHAAFRQHQLQDRGFGPSLGVGAADCLVQVLEQAGYRVRRAATLWRIPSQDQGMIREMAQGIAQAATESLVARGEDASFVGQWLLRKRALLGHLALTVSHVDVLGRSGSGESALK